MRKTSPRAVYQQGDHVCTLYGSRLEQLSAAIEYIRGGLARGERCLYVCGEHTLDEFRQALKRADIDVNEQERRGALVLLTKHDGHLKGGSFSADKMITMLKEAVAEALAAGFNGLCAAGDMSWVLDGAPGTDELLEYEARLNDFYRDHRALGLCQYHRDQLPERILESCIATHPHVRVTGTHLLSNPFYELPAEAMKRPVRDGKSTNAKLARLAQLIPA